MGGRGSRRAPECSTELRLSRSFALPLWPTSRAPVPRRLPASPPLPHGRGSWLTAWCVVRGAALPGGLRGTKGNYTPHPRPLSPARGEGWQVRFPLQLKNTKSSPCPRRGRGVGGEGARHPGKRIPGGEKIRARCSGWKARATKKIANRRAGCTAGMTRTACRALQLSHPQTTVCGSPDTSSGKIPGCEKGRWRLFYPSPCNRTSPIHATLLHCSADEGLKRRREDNRQQR